MKMSLRAAHRLETRINEYLLRSIEFNKDFNTFQYTELNNSSNNYCCVNVKEDLENAKDETKQKIDEYFKLLMVRYRLRREIGSSNEEFGINEALAFRKKLLDELEMIKKILSYEKDSKKLNQTGLKNKLISLRLNTQKVSFASDDVTVCTIDPSVIESMVALKLVTKKELESIEDKLIRLNIGTTIDIDEEDYNLLSKLNLI